MISKHLPKKKRTYCQEYNDNAACYIARQNPQISPPMRKIVSQWLIKLISALVCTILTVFSCIVQDVTRSTTRKEALHVSTTCFVTRSSKILQFGRTTVHHSSMEFGDQHAGNESSKGI